MKKKACLKYQPQRKHEVKLRKKNEKEIEKYSYAWEKCSMQYNKNWITRINVLDTFSCFSFIWYTRRSDES